MKNSDRFFLILLVLVVAGSVSALADDPPTIAWGKQIGFSQDNLKVTADRFGNCFICGTTSDSLAPSYVGNKDAFIRKFDKDGNVQWTIQIGTSQIDNAYAIAADNEGNCFLTGETRGDLEGANSGRYDAFLVKLNPAGQIVWKKQFGSDRNDRPAFVFVDAVGFCYITGYTQGNLDGTNAGGTDAFLAKFDKDGSQIWLRQYGTAGAEAGEYIAVDPLGNCHVELSTKSILKYDSAGNYLDSFQHTLSSFSGIVVDDELNFYIGGYSGTIAILVKYDANRDRKWQKTFGMGSWSGINGMLQFRDGTGDILVGGCQNWPDCIAFCRRYDSEGQLKWVYALQDEDVKNTCGQKVATDGDGNCFIVGYTKGNLFGERTKAQEMFLAKVAVFEPSTVDYAENNPDEFELSQNFPNPFNPVTTIHYSLSHPAYLRLTVYNMNGQVVKNLANWYQAAGEYSAIWDAKDENGNPVGSGIYVYKLSTPEHQTQRKMLLLR